MLINSKELLLTAQREHFAVPGAGIIGERLSRLAERAEERNFGRSAALLFSAWDKACLRQKENRIRLQIRSFLPAH